MDAPRSYEFWVGPAAEWRARFPGPKYRWAHSDLRNSGFQYRVGRCVHPAPECLCVEPAEMARDRPPEMNWFWFLDAQACASLEGSGARLMRVHVPDCALVYVHEGKPWFRASEFVLEDVKCARCEIRGLIDSGAMGAEWAPGLSEYNHLMPAGVRYHYRGCKNAGLDGAPELPEGTIIPNLGGD